MTAVVKLEDARRLGLLDTAEGGSTDDGNRQDLQVFNADDWSLPAPPSDPLLPGDPPEKARDKAEEVELAYDWEKAAKIVKNRRMLYQAIRIKVVGQWQLGIWWEKAPKKGPGGRTATDAIAVGAKDVFPDLEERAGQKRLTVWRNRFGGADELELRDELISQVQASSWRSMEKEKTGSTRDLLGQSDQNDWRTPRKFLDAARRVMGAIDLDPATSAEANETVQAVVFYTEDDDGLTLPWKGRLWLNPPYGGKAKLFVERLIKEYQVGNVTEACLLVNCHPTETKWFQQLFEYAVCFVAGRIDFGGPSREVSSTPTHGTAIAYLGKNVGAFSREFSKFGAVVVRYDDRLQEAQIDPLELQRSEAGMQGRE